MEIFLICRVYFSLFHMKQSHQGAKHRPSQAEGGVPELGCGPGQSAAALGFARSARAAPARPRARSVATCAWRPAAAVPRCGSWDYAPEAAPTTLQCAFEHATLYVFLLVSCSVWCILQVAVLMPHHRSMHSEHNAARSLLQNDGSFDKNTLSIAFFVVVAVLLLIAAGCILWLCRTLIVHRADLSAPHRATPEETITQVALWVPNTSTPTTDGIAQSAPGLGRHTASSSLPLSEATANLRAATAPVSTGSTGTGPIPPAKGRQECRSCRQPKVRPMLHAFCRAAWHNPRTTKWPPVLLLNTNSGTVPM